MNTILNKVKLALRIVTDAFDSEIEDLIKACLLDLKIAGVNEYNIETVTDPLIIRAICTYCKYHFGDADGVEKSDRLKASYDEQKAQLQMSTGYTNWGNNE